MTFDALKIKKVTLVDMSTIIQICYIFNLGTSTRNFFIYENLPMMVVMMMVVVVILFS